MLDGPAMGMEGLQLAAKLMDLTQERQRVISNNIANASTPSYIRKDLEFTAELARALENGGEVADLHGIRGTLEEDLSDTPRMDGNNVVLPKEMNAMMQNGLYYKLLARSFTTRLNILRSAIK